MSATDCPKCGAPQRPGFVLCPFCRAAYSPELLRAAIPCGQPACKEPSAWGQMKCVRCSTWIVVQCLFCGNVSPHNQSACLTCGEAFRGMAERRAQREAQRQQEAQQRQAQIDAQQRAQAVSSYGGVAASFLGSLAGAIVSGACEGESFSVDTGGSWFSDDSGDSSEDFDQEEDEGDSESEYDSDDPGELDDSYTDYDESDGDTDDSSW
jgi:uncharacterized Zn finger protein (UPF0148 family)